MSSKNSSTSAGGAASKYEARLCHVVKRSDFDGYGFNLHAEKGRPGQYIGKVDDGSPAEAAGLRQGDRILEVNGTNITSEAHKKVVELIKGIPNETKLLVIDPRADANELKAAIAKNKSATAAVAGGGGHVDVNDNSKQSSTEKMTMEKTMTNGKDSLNENSSKQAANQNKHDVNGSSTHNEDANNKKNSSSNNNNNNSSSGSANNNVDTTANNNKKMTTTTTAAAAMTNGEAKQKQPATAVVEHIIEDTKTLSVSGSAAADSNGKMVPSANGSTKDGPKLNLNMTAAELRAQLAARKKYDPKNDVCDLRKKYEIIQKM